MKQQQHYIDKLKIIYRSLLSRLKTWFYMAQKRIKRLPGYHVATRLIERYRLSVAIGLVVVVSLLLTSTSVLLYTLTGSSKVDLSRPGFESAREETKNIQKRNAKFSASGPLDDKTIDSFLADFRDQANLLEQYDTFEPKILDDEQLGLHQVNTITPSDGANAQ